MTGSLAGSMQFKGLGDFTHSAPSSFGSEQPYHTPSRKERALGSSCCAKSMRGSHFHSKRCAFRGMVSAVSTTMLSAHSTAS